MQFKIVNLRVKNFKCFDDTKYYEFSIKYDRNPIILSGPNGFGKTTFFDAVELIFSKNITRLDKGIEKRNTNLGKNILLNKANKDGYIVLTLQNERKEYLTLFAKILQSNRKLEVENSILYGDACDYIETSQLDDFMNEYSEWSANINNNVIKYRVDNFNVYYYISQAESVHFLKRTIADRKDAMNVLLNTKDIDVRRTRVNELIGGKINTTGHLVNDELMDLDKNINAKLELLKKMNRVFQEKGLTESEKIELGLYERNKDLFVWDSPDIECKDRSENVNSEEKLKAVLSFLDNEKDYYNYMWNNELINLLESKGVEDYVKYKRFFEAGKIIPELVEKELKNIDFLIDIFNYSEFFRTEKINVSLYKEDNIMKLRTMIPELEHMDFSLVKNLVDEIKFLSKTLSSNQKIVDKLVEARKSLHSANDEYDSNSKRCPFCHTSFEDKISLEKGFEEVDIMLKISIGENFTQIQIKKETLLHTIKSIKDIIVNKLGDLDSTGVTELIKKKTQLQNFSKDAGRVRKVEKILLYVGNSVLDEQLEDSQKVIEINQILSKQVKTITNNQFEMNMQLYSYDMVENRYKNYLNELRSKHMKGQLQARLKYIQSVVFKRENDETELLKKELVELLKRKKRVAFLRDKLVALNKEYGKSIDEYKNMTLKSLRVPLLIYTGKILQDYQNGLGVFVNKDEMRFVSNGDAKHDILNTFSSGQLSGFVLAFLFAMNKQYIKKSDDDLGFVLIDDPVQTMDDINISSLIEVLRNDFADKQIIISTHESEKENYILYKFFKYNQIGQSFNVKEELYGV